MGLGNIYVYLKANPKNNINPTAKPYSIGIFMRSGFTSQVTQVFLS